MSAIEYSNTSRRLSALISDMVTDTITIPPHQRDYVWTTKQQVKLVDAIQTGMPMPNITFRNKRVGKYNIITLEDGQQRLTTLRRYMANSFRDSNGRLFNDLSPVEQAEFESYTVNVMTYSNATDEQAIVIFNNLQNGSSCSIGERVYSLSRISPLVQFTLETLLTPGSGFYERTVPFWGERTAKGQRGKYMTEAFALCAGLAHGSQYISKKWTDIEDIVARPFSREKLLADLEFIISLYEEVHREAPITTKKLKKFYWDLSNFTAYIIHAMTLTEALEPLHPLPSRTDIHIAFREFMIEQRLHPEILTERLHAGIPRGNGGGHWDQRRWHNGWLRIFAPTADVVEEDSDTSSEEDAE
jgi:hypothetical protein